MKRDSKFKINIKKICNHWQRLKAYGAKKKSPLLSFHIDGGFGDHLIAARFIRDLQLATIPFEFDIYSRRVSLNDWLFAGVSGYRYTFQPKADYKILRREYVAEINVHSCPTLRDKDKIFIKHNNESAKLSKAIENIKKGSILYQREINNRPHFDGYFGQKVALLGLKRHNFGHYLAGIEYNKKSWSIDVDESIFDEIKIFSNEYITVSNGYDDAIKPGESGLITKVFPYFDDVLKILKNKIPENIKFIQIGSANCSPLKNVDINLTGETNLKQVSALVKKAKLHIDNEGGLVHLANILGVRSAVFFGPTDPNYFSYDENVNFIPNACGGCWWMYSDWMQSCAKGDLKPRCMNSHDINYVADTIASEIIF